MCFPVKQFIHISTLISVDAGVHQGSPGVTLCCRCVCRGFSSAGGERPSWSGGLHPLFWTLDRRQQLRTPPQRVLLQRRLLQRKYSHSNGGQEVGGHAAREIQHGGQRMTRRLQRDHKEPEEDRRRDVSLQRGGNSSWVAPGGHPYSFKW